jgi:cytochrome c-type biogenesis protein CcmH/NrfF
MRTRKNRAALMAMSACLLMATAPITTFAATPPAQTVPAPNSPQAIQELHEMLRNAYTQGEMAAQANPAEQPAHRPVLAAWVEVLRDAIMTIGSAAFIAAWGFTIGMILLGAAALVFAIRWRRSS